MAIDRYRMEFDMCLDERQGRSKGWKPETWF
jgi:hypothetical protein